MGLTPTPVAERPSLTREDIEVLALLADGLPLSTIGRRLHLSERSIRRRLRAARPARRPAVQPGALPGRTHQRRYGEGARGRRRRAALPDDRLAAAAVQHDLPAGCGGRGWTSRSGRDSVDDSRPDRVLAHR